MTTVSVIIPHLNQHQTLLRCLESLQDQAGLLEIIVVDNGSMKSLEEIAAAFPHVIFLAESAAGPGPARNRGAASAKGDVLAFIDADCRADANWLAEALAALHSAPSKGVIGGDVRIDVHNPKHLTPLEAYECVFAYRQRLYIDRHHYSGTGNLIMKREVFHMVGAFAGIGMAEDADWGRRAWALGFGAIYVPRAIVYHPARISFDEIEAKWGRHIAHDRSLLGQGAITPPQWELRRWMLLVSWLPHSFKVLTSRRLSGFRNRLRGVRALMHTRVFRFREMGAAGARQVTGAEAWNRG